MYLIKYNPFSKKYYKYDTDEYDIFSPMFDAALHNNEMTPMCLSKTTCMYCNTEFASRNKLFYHLGFMGIDVFAGKPKDYYKLQEWIKEGRREIEMDPEFGDEYIQMKWEEDEKQHKQKKRWKTKGSIWIHKVRQVYKKKSKRQGCEVKNGIALYEEFERKLFVK